ncbi:MAG: glycosyltransferase family 4 protein [Deltaproteobacteria bacterium]|nr:glycosyltransferase family 4 protein [Deltaproteobacteria bacterium]
MRVLMFCSQFRPVIGGAERQAELLARTLIGQGCHVEVLTVQQDPAHPLLEDAEGLRIHRFPMTDLTKRFPGVGGLGVPNLLIERVQLHRAVRRLIQDFDVFHAHIASPLVGFAQEVARAEGRPTICKIACGGRGFDFLALRRGSLLGQRIERNLVEKVDRWIAISREVHEDLSKSGVPDHRVVTIPNGIDVAAAATPRARAPARRFLCLGRLVKFDFESLLGAFQDLLAEAPDAELRIAGGGDVEGLRERLARLPSGARSISAVGFSPTAEEFAWADALIHPSRAEGMSNVLLEALAAGLPCAASDIEPNREVLGEAEAGLLFPLGNRAALHEVMRALASDGALSRRLVAAGHARVRAEYEIGVVAGRYRSLYRELVA